MSSTSGKAGAIAGSAEGGKRYVIQAEGCLVYHSEISGDPQEFLLSHARAIIVPGTVVKVISREGRGYRIKILRPAKHNGTKGWTPEDTFAGARIHISGD